MIALSTESRPARAGSFKLVRAPHLGMCFGVRDAIDLALDQSAAEPVTILGDLVHNESVLADLRSRGIQVAQQAAAVTTPAVMITAHGASQKTIHRAREHGLRVIEATCPLVHAAHRAVARLAREGFYPVIIGKREHVEVRGMTEDLADYEVVLTAEDLARLPARPRFGVVAQTTQPIDRVRRLVELLCKQFPAAEVRFIDTVCQPTKQRQQAADQLSRECDVIVVIGGAQSNNTKELAATCARHGARVHHVQTAADLRLEWFINAENVGVTAGTSTPDNLIAAVEHRLEEFARRLGADEIRTRRNHTAQEPVITLQAV